MKTIKLICGLVMLAWISGSGMALADRGHGHGHSHFGLGFYFGGPYAYPYYPYPYYYPYYPPVVAVPSQPPVYIEEGDEQAEAQDYWYHCNKPEGYYPYIKNCPGGWERVVPTPPSGE